jgi:hypothetical protein
LKTRKQKIIGVKTHRETPPKIGQVANTFIFVETSLNIRFSRNNTERATEKRVHAGTWEY